MRPFKNTHAVQFLGDTGKEVVLHAKSQTIHSPAEKKILLKRSKKVVNYIMMSRQNVHSSLPKITKIKFKINQIIMMVVV